VLRLPPFRYQSPKSLRQALALKADAGPEGAFVAGGTDLYPNMKRRQVTPKVVISLAGVRALARAPSLSTAEGVCTVGSMVTLSALAEHHLIQRHYAVVAHAARLVSTPLLRNMGTLGGNLCLDTRCNYYDQTYEWRKAIQFCLKKDGDTCWVAPGSARCWAVNSSDLAPVMVALDAQYVVVGPEGERLVPAAGFYRNDGIAHLAKQPDEVLTAVRLPAPDGWDAWYEKLRRRGSFDFPVLGVAVWVRWEGTRAVEARVVLGAVSSSPQPVPEASQAIVGTALEDEAIEAAATAAFRPSKPMDNTDFGLAWRKEMTKTLVRRALFALRRRRLEGPTAEGSS
jgi:4-hydroxybenzoyl-CoA reductase subunit beta